MSQICLKIVSCRLPPGSGRSAARSWRAARKEYRFQLAGRPQGLSFSGGRTRTPGTPRTPKTGQMLGAKRCQYTRQLQARSATHGPANRRCEALPIHAPIASAKRYHEPANRRCEALSMHRPGCLGCPGCPGQGAGPAKRPSAYLGHRQVAIHFQPLPVGGPPARSAASCGRAARKEFHFPAGGPGHPRQGKQNACAPGTRASTNWDSRLPGGGMLGQWASRLLSHRHPTAVAASCDPPARAHCGRAGARPSRTNH